MFALLASTVAVRVWWLLDRPLWFDEIFTLWAARQPLEGLLEALRHDSGPPAFYLLEKPFVHLAEASNLDALARLPSLAAALGLFGAAFALKGKLERLRFLLLLACFPLLLVYSAEARAYALVSLASLLLFLLAVRGEQDARRLLSLTAVTALALYLHYLALFAVAALLAIAALGGRWKTVAALLAGAVLFLPWTPVLAAQPQAALAWVEEGTARTLISFLSALGGAGRVLPPLGGPLPPFLVALGVAVAAVLTVSVIGRARSDAETRYAALFVLLVLSEIVLGSLWRSIAFPGRSEMAVLAVWLWAVCRGSQESRLARWGIAAASLVGMFGSFSLLAAPPAAPQATQIVAALNRVARKGDSVFAGADLYLPARLASERGELAATVRPLPLSLKDHPGWFAPEPPAETDEAALEKAVRQASPGQRIYLLLPSWLRTPRIAAILAVRGSTRQIPYSPGMSLVLWTLPPAVPARSPRAR